MIQPFYLTNANLLYLQDKLARLDFSKQWLVCHNAKSDSYQQEAKVQCEKFEKVKS